MSWNRFSTTPNGYGVTGGSARLTAGQSSQLVKAGIGGPATWCITLQSDTSSTFVIDAGCGQSLTTHTIVVKGGRSYLTIVAEEVQVNATAGTSTAQVFAAAAPDNGPQGAPTTAVGTSLTLTGGVTTAFPASGRVRLTVHNNTTGDLQVQVGGVDAYRVAAQGTVDFAWTGAIGLRPATTGVVNVVEYFQ